MNKRKMHIAVNALSISLLTALSLTPTGSDAKATGNQTEAAAPAAKAKDLTPEEKFSETKQEAEAGDASAQYTLGAMYAAGNGVPKDEAKAVGWYQKAAAQGLARAQHNLGLMYWFGNGVSKNYVLAYAWLNLSAAQGNDSAKDLRDRCEEALTSAQRAEAQRLSTNWKKGELL